MRSLFISEKLSNFKKKSSYFELSEASKLNHLTKVLRVRVGEKVIIFNEDGAYSEGEIKEITRQKILFYLGEIKFYKSPHSIELGLAWLKKDALEEAINGAIQLGVSKIHLFSTEYSQKEQDLTKKRWDRLVISSMEQSNHYIRPEIKIYPNLFDFVNLYEKDYSFYGFSLLGKVIEKNENEKENKNKNKKKLSTKGIYLIGPEGGFTQREVDELGERGVNFFHLNTAIMRSPIAVSCAMGYILAQMKKIV